MPFAFERDSSYFDMVAAHKVGNTDFNKVVHVATETEGKELCEWLNTMEEKITAHNKQSDAICPHCGSVDIWLSQFGGSKYCKSCHLVWSN